MTDFETANQLTDTMSLFLQCFALLSTVIFAYITGAFYFLHRAPLFTKIVSFVFLVFATAFILINMLGAFYHYMALADQYDQLIADGSTVVLTEAVQTGRTRPMAVAGVWTVGPVMGSYFVDGAINRDYTLVMGALIIYATLIVLFNLVADILYALLDPKVKYD